MKKLFLILILFPFLFTSQAWSQVDSVLVSDVKFKNPKYDNPHAGSGFLLKYNNQIYACTAKHVLYFAKTDSMKTISFGDDLASWEFVSKVNQKVRIQAGKLLNEDKGEAIAMPPKGDWLVFEVLGEIPENIAVYTLRAEALKKDEPVYFLGYPYSASVPVKVQGKYLGRAETGGLSLDVPKGNYAGCSGGPVLDRNNQLVGTVSMGYFNESEDKMIFEPESLDYLIQVIQNHQRKSN